MTYKRQTKTPWCLSFLAYWMYYDIIWSVLATSFIFLMELFTDHATTFINILFSRDNIAWLGFLPPMFFVAYNTVGTMVESVIINKEEKTMRVIHRPLFFWKKEIKFSLDDDKFVFSHSSENKNLKSILLRWNTELFWESLQFYNKGFKNVVILHDVCGWRNEQLKMIYSELSSISCIEDGKQ